MDILRGWIILFPTPLCRRVYWQNCCSIWELRKAIICGHSLGCAITVAMAVHHPHSKFPACCFWRLPRIPGLLVLIGITKWPRSQWLGGYLPTFLHPFIGWFVFDDGIKSVFTPNAVPADYVEKSGTRIALRVDGSLVTTRLMLPISMPMSSSFRRATQR